MDVVELPLTNGGLALIDAQDTQRVDRFAWYLAHRGYVQTVCRVAGTLRIIRLHQLLLDFPKSMIDHRDRNKLNNCRANLRHCTNSQNQANRVAMPHSSVFKGVTVQARTGRFESQIWHNNKRIYLGTFDSEVDAALAYDREALRRFGEFSCLNFSAE
jgi:hypothetical protein